MAHKTSRRQIDRFRFKSQPTPRNGLPYCSLLIPTLDIDEEETGVLPFKMTCDLGVNPGFCHAPRQMLWPEQTLVLGIHPIDHPLDRKLLVSAGLRGVSQLLAQLIIAQELIDRRG